MKKYLIILILFGSCKYFDVDYKHKCQFIPPSYLKLVYDTTLKEYFAIDTQGLYGDIWLWKTDRIKLCYDNIARTGDDDSCEEKGLIREYYLQK